MIGKIIYGNLYISLPNQKDGKGIQANRNIFFESRIPVIVTIHSHNNQFILIGLQIHFKTKQVRNT